jgi:hypothetical protein
MEAVGLQSGCRFDWLRLKYGKKIRTDNVYQYDIKIQYMISSIFEDLDYKTSRFLHIWPVMLWPTIFQLNFIGMEQSKRKKKNNLKETNVWEHRLVWWKLQSVKKTILRSIPCNISILMGIKSGQFSHYSKPNKVKIVISILNLNSQTECVLVSLGSLRMIQIIK